MKSLQATTTTLAAALLCAILAPPLAQLQESGDHWAAESPESTDRLMDPARLERLSELAQEYAARVPPAASHGAPSPRLQALASAVNVDEMMALLRAISVDIPTRYWSTAGMESATQYMLDRFDEFQLDRAYFDPITEGSTIRNVVGVKLGRSTPERIYIVGGHLDSYSPERMTLAPGAEDNGTGSAGVAEIARLLAPLELSSTVYFVCFTAEEGPGLGSKHLSQIALDENWDLRGVLNMDMVGYDAAGTPEMLLEGFPSDPRSVALMNVVEATSTTYGGLTVLRYPDDGWGSDHVSFHRRGFPAIMTIDLDFDRYPCYHQTCDTIDKIDAEHFRRMVASVATATAKLAGVRFRFASIEGIADRRDSTDDAGVRIDVAGTGYEPVRSAAGGVFSLANLVPGSYTIRAQAAGYKTAQRRIVVAGGTATKVKLSLAPQ
ncbi:MAG: M28 family peptidase [Acidobacteriota bacterium]